MNNTNNFDQNTEPNNNRYSKLENGMRYLRNDQFFYIWAWSAGDHKHVCSASRSEKHRK